MDLSFIPSDEQAMLRDAARRWVDKDFAEGMSIADQWRHFSDMGWLMAALPEEVGGLGGIAADAAVIAEEIGHALVTAPFVDVAVTSAQLLLALAPERLPALTLGETLPIVAHWEVAARGDRSWVETRAEPDGDGWRLTGRKTGVVGAPHADSLLVTAMIETRGLGIFEVQPEHAGILPFVSIDERHAAELRLAGAPAVLLGEGDKAVQALDAALDHALVLESAEAVGAMQEVVDLTRDYLGTRKQFGRSIGEFQALQHQLADMFIALEQARSIVIRALEALRSGAPLDRAMLAAATKARTAQAAAVVGGKGIQLHGGIGVTEEYLVGRLFRRLTAFAVRHGSADVQIERYTEISASLG